MIRHTSTVLILLLSILSGCYTHVPTPEPPASAAPAQTSEHYYSFPSADALARYLRVDSEAGPLVSAHRGGPAPTFPENAIPTFERTLWYGPALIECDVRMTADSHLVLMHDETVDRTTTGAGRVDELRLDELRRLRLVDDWGRVTSYRIDTVAEALAWAEGRAVLTLDVKPDVPPERVVDLIRRHDAANRAAVIVYSLEDLIRYHELMPDLVLSASAETIEAVEAILESGVDPSRLMAFTGVGEVKPEVIRRLREYNIRPILGTFGEIDARARRGGPEVFDRFIEQGVDILATDVPALALRAVQRYEPAPSPSR